MTPEDLHIDPDDMTLELDISKLPTSCAIIICEGRAKLRALPSFGEYRIITHQGKVKRMQIEQAEEF
ncbi:MAG TPA: XtrA/YqaO family protein [Atopostipes sp.]|nr:XtrA/YqaO family protein [Atopostipes sp.]